MDIPKDPAMLLSFINMKLRDRYPSLYALCEDMELDMADISDVLEKIDYHYDKEKNCFC